MTSNGFDEGYETDESEGVKVTDRRRIDPETGEVRPPEASDPDPSTAGEDAAQEVTEDTSDAVAELTADLQRVAAEYKNYRTRANKQIEEQRTLGKIDVVTALLDTLDDLTRASEHGELEGTAKVVSDKLTAALTNLGVERYGTVGDVFDPQIHEAFTHSEEEGHDQPTVGAVYQPGYRLGDRIIRVARVGVVE